MVRIIPLTCSSYHDTSWQVCVSQSTQTISHYTYIKSKVLIMALNFLGPWFSLQHDLTTPFLTNFRPVFQNSREHTYLTALPLFSHWPGDLLPNHLLDLFPHFTVITTEISPVTETFLPWAPSKIAFPSPAHIISSPYPASFSKCQKLCFLRKKQGKQKENVNKRRALSQR